MDVEKDIFFENEQGLDVDVLVEETICGVLVNSGLTKREKEILRLIVSGKTNKEIAKDLCRVERTIEYHRNRIMCKLDAHNISDLFKKAILMGIMP